MLEWLVPEVKSPKTLTADIFGGENVLDCLTSFDVALNYPSASYTQSFGGATANVSISLSNSHTAGLKFETAYGLAGIKLLTCSKSTKYSPAEVENADNIVKLGYTDAVFGGAKGYTLCTKKGIVFACFNELADSVTHPVRESIKSCREVLQEDQRKAMVFSKLKKDIAEDVGYMAFAPLAWFKYLFQKDSITEASNVALSAGELKAPVNTADSNFTVKTTDKIQIDAKKAGKTVIFANNGNTALPEPDNIEIDGNNLGAAVVLKDSGCFITAKNKIKLEKENHNGIVFTQEQMVVKVGGNNTVVVKEDSIELNTGANGKLTFSGSEMKGIGDKLTCSDTQFKFANNTITKVNVGLGFVVIG